MIPVLWVSRHENILARGYWDQALVETLFDNTLWHPVNGFEFEHHIVGLPPMVDFPDVDGAVVVVPARHHVNDVAWLKSQLGKMNWCILMLLGDEEWDFPWQEFPETGSMKVWIMQAKPGHENVSVRIPCGFYPQTREHIQVENVLDKKRDWMFAGQDTNQRRHELVQVLGGLAGGQLTATAGYLHGAVNGAGLSREKYHECLASSKVVPCPSGPESVCTARVEEALEAGCVPIVDARKPSGDQYDYWRLTFGDAPLRQVENWADFPDILKEELALWPKNVNVLSNWWQQWKRNLAYTLRDQISTLTAKHGSRGTLLDNISVVVTTSPASLHPSTRDVEIVLDSIREQLPHSEIIIVADGVRPEQAHLAGDYEEYLRRLYAITNSMRNVLLIRLPEWVHQANATKAAMAFVKTPYFVFVEHDTPLYGSIPWESFVGILDEQKANCIRLHFDVGIHPEHEAIMKDHGDVLVNGIPMRRTKVWWQRPHIASTEFYNKKILSVFAQESRTMIEDVIYGMMYNSCTVRSQGGFGRPTRDDKWDEWRVWVYTPQGDMKRSGHLDTRGPDPKYGMHFIYQGEQPFGAPTDTEEARNFTVPGKPRE